MSPRLFRRTAPTDRRPVPEDLRVLIVAAFIIAVGFGIVAPVLPQFAASFDVGYAAAGAVISVFAVMRLVWAPAAGGIMGRIGERGTYLIGLTVVALSSLATAFAANFPMLLVLRGLGGIGSVMFTVSAMGLIARRSPVAIRGKISGYYATAFLLGNILGPVLGSVIAIWGLRAPFIIYAVALAGAIGVAAWKLRPLPATTETGSIMLPMKLSAALPLPEYKALMVSSFAHGWTNFGARTALIPLLAALVMADAEAGARVAGVGLAMIAAGAAVAQVLFSGWSDRVGRRPVMLVGLACSAVLTGALGFSGSQWALWGLCLAGGFAVGLYAPAQQAALADVVGHRRSGGSVMAAFQASADSGAIIAPVLLGWVADLFGFGPAFALCGAVFAVALLIWALLPRSTSLR